MPFDQRCVHHFYPRVNKNAEHVIVKFVSQNSWVYLNSQLPLS
jgi:hypothetical protein